MPRKINLHIEKFVLDGFTKKEGALIIETIKSSLSERLSKKPIQTEQSGFVTQIQTRPIIVNHNMHPTLIGRKAAEQIHKSINF